MCHPGFLYPVKISVKNKRKIKTFHIMKGEDRVCHSQTCTYKNVKESTQDERN